MITKEESNFIKLVAMATMLIDHVGAFLFPLEILRIIGRISFPLFAYQLGVGYKNTSNKKEYTKRLFFFAIISQIPFYLLKQDYSINILFSLIVGIFAIFSIEKRNFFYLFSAIIASYFVEYGLYGLAVILIFYFFKENIKRVPLFFISTLIFSLYFTIYSQIFALFSLVFILGPKLKINLPKYFFYIFYPAHLFVIYLIKIIFL